MAQGGLFGVGQCLTHFAVVRNVACQDWLSVRCLKSGSGFRWLTKHASLGSRDHRAGCSPAMTPCQSCDIHRTLPTMENLIGFVTHCVPRYVHYPKYCYMKYY